MKRLSTVIPVLILSCSLASAVMAQQGKKCFFESDCPKTFTCITPKGEMNGTCQPTGTVQPDQTKPGASVPSIISEEGKCTFNTDCPNGGQCIKQAGALFGKCEGTGYGTQINQPLWDQKRTCFFDQDCKPGQRCAKPQGSFKGMCEDAFFDSSQSTSNDPREMLRNQFRTSNKRCLQDGDCGIRESCIVQERSVFGLCMPKDTVGITTAFPGSNFFPSSTTSSDPFKF
jgi:hypothetical protein